MVSFPPVSPPRPYTPPSPHPYAPHAQPISFFPILSPAQENTLYFTNKYSCVRQVHTLYISYFYHPNLSPLCCSTPSLSRATPPTPFAIVTGRTRKGFTFRSVTNLKFSEVRLKFQWKWNAHNITESRKFLERNKTINMSTHMPNTGPSQTGSCHVWRDTGKSERAEGQKLFHTAGSSADSANVRRHYLLTYLLTYSMVQGPSWEANWFAASQEIPRILWNPKVHYRTHKRPPPVSILDHPNPVHIPTSHLLEIHPNIIHSSTPRSPQWSLSLRFPHQDPIHPPLLTHTRRMPSPSHSSRFYHPHNIGWGLQII